MVTRIEFINLVVEDSEGFVVAARTPRDSLLRISDDFSNVLGSSIPPSSVADQYTHSELGARCRFVNCIVLWLEQAMYRTHVVDPLAVRQIDRTSYPILNQQPCGGKTSRRAQILSLHVGPFGCAPKHAGSCREGNITLTSGQTLSRLSRSV
jgi:hypothetical protein